jgi:hypothetical protein
MTSDIDPNTEALINGYVNLINELGVEGAGAVSGKLYRLIDELRDGGEGSNSMAARMGVLEKMYCDHEMACGRSRSPYPDYQLSNRQQFYSNDRTFSGR